MLGSQPKIESRIVLYFAKIAEQLFESTPARINSLLESANVLAENGTLQESTVIVQRLVVARAWGSTVSSSKPPIV
jgi:hypothetical protein